MKIQDLSLWEAFYWVAKDESFTKAASRLKIGTPFLSKKVAKLEDTLGLRLFLRSTRKVGLTGEGRSILSQVESFLEDYRSFEDRFQSEEELSGTIRLTCTSGLANRILPQVILKFCEQHPKIKFEIDASDQIVNLIESQTDLAIRIQPPPENSELIYKPIGANELIFCASPSYLGRTKLPLKRIEDLSRHPLIMFGVYENCSIKGHPLKLKNLSESKRIEANSGTFLTELALRGGGIAVRSKWDVRDYLAKGDLKQVLQQYHIVNPQSIYVVIPGRRLMTLRVRIFLNFLEESAKSWS